MGLSNYSVSLTLKSSNPLNEISDYGIFENLLSVQDTDECYLHISTELGYLLHSEEQFNNKFKDEHGTVKYSDFLGIKTLEKLGTLQDAKPWFESKELTVIDSTDEDFEILKSNKLGDFLLDLKKYLDGFKWHSEKPKMMNRLDEINLLIAICKFCSRNDIEIKMIEA